MKIVHRTRRLVALFAVLGVLFSQLAVAAYACPGSDGMIRASLASPAESPDCHELPGPEGVDALCRAHCQQGDQSLERTAAPVMAAAMPVGFAVLRVESACGADGPTRPQPSLLARPTEPPAAVRHCRFLI